MKIDLLAAYLNVMTTKFLFGPNRTNSMPYRSFDWTNVKRIIEYLKAVLTLCLKR